MTRWALSEFSILTILSVIVGAEKSVLSVQPCTVRLPGGTMTIARGVAALAGRSGRPIVLGGPSALRPTDDIFAPSQDIRFALQLFADHVNRVRGGVRVGAERHPLHVLFVGEGPSPGEQITNATAHATQCHGVDFVVGGLCLCACVHVRVPGVLDVWILLTPTACFVRCAAGYSSSRTLYTARQAAADGRLIISGGSAAPGVFRQNNISFSALPPAGTWLHSSIDAVVAAAAAIDAKEMTPASARCGAPCVENLVFGMIVMDGDIFAAAVCEPAAQHAAGVALSPDGVTPLKLTVTVDTAHDLELRAALRELQAAGVTVLGACVHGGTSSKTLIDTLKAIDWAPLAVFVGSGLCLKCVCGMCVCVAPHPLCVLGVTSTCQCRSDGHIDLSHRPSAMNTSTCRIVPPHVTTVVFSSG